MCHNIGNNISPVSNRSGELSEISGIQNTSKLNNACFHLNEHFNFLYKQNDAA